MAGTSSQQRFSSQQHSPAARWGLLVVSLAMGLTLIGTSIAGYVAAHSSYIAVSRAMAEHILHRTRREIRQSEGDLQGGLDWALAEMSQAGLRYVAVEPPPPGALIEAGVTKVTAEEMARAPRRILGRRGPQFLWLKAERLVRVEAMLFGPKGKKNHGPRRQRQRMARSRLVIEFEPVVAKAVLSRASVSLGVSLGAAILLLLATVIFWRLSRRADQIQAQLAKDSELVALGQMSAVLGHEIRNPLASLKGHAQLLVEKLADHPGQEGASIVVQEATRIEKLSAQILDFAKTGSLDRTPCDPASVLHEALQRTEVDPVEVTVAEDLPLWSLDRERMVQVLLNVLSNAKQASPEGVAIEVAVLRRGERLVFEVADGGEGISPGDEEKIFEPFYTARTKGTGLGLALAARIVEGHGGRIIAENRVRGGARFLIELPA